MERGNTEHWHTQWHELYNMKQLHGMLQHITLWNTQWQQLYNMGNCTTWATEQHGQLYGTWQHRTLAYTMALTVQHE